MKKLILLYTYLLLITSCTSLLEEDPKIFISPEAFYQNLEEATSAVYSTYDVLPPLYGLLGMPAFADISSNSFKVTSSSAADFQPYDINTIGTTNNLVANFWTNSYQGINRANTVINRVPNIPGDDVLKSELIAEAKFMRALLYFNLVRLFGDVPLNLNETISLDNLNLGRSPQSDIYQQIIDDLIESAKNLPQSPKESGRAFIGAAKSLLAKVYITKGDFLSALPILNEIIESDDFGLMNNYADVFKEANDNGIESIFAVQFNSTTDGNNLNGWCLSQKLSAYVNGTPVFDIIEVSDELFNSYEIGDNRKQLNAVTEYVTMAGDTINFQALIFKYTDGIFTDKGESYNNTYNSDVNIPILRFADILLMFAEAENLVNGPTTQAFEALNKVRRRAFGVDINSGSEHDITGLSQEDLNQAIWLERFREFPLEGQQWFDLIRTNRAESTLGISSNQTLYPIPQRELDINDQLTQNPGY